MAFDHDGFFAIIGKYVKLIDQVDGYIDAIESRKVEIRDIYDTEGILDTYITVPPIAASMQQSVTAWIDTLVADLNNLITNRPYVIEQLAVDAYDVTSILNAIYDYMDDNEETIESSVVSLGGADVDEAASVDPVLTGGSRLFATRILDGVNAPGNGATPHIRYLGVEGQLARTTTMHAKITGTTVGSETALIFSDAVETRPYVLEDEEPGTGPTLTSAGSQNMIGNNPNFNSWVGNEPSNWAMTGGTAGTAWADASGTGLGPLRVKTVNVEAAQQLTGLARNTMYFIAASAELRDSGANSAVFNVKVRNLNDTQDYMTARSHEITLASEQGQAQGVAFGFFYLDDSVNLDNVYVEIKLTTAPDTSTGDQTFDILRVVLCPAQYYNGLGLAWWYTNSTSALPATLGTQVDLAVANNDNGVFQRFFRKAFNIQLPTADSPTISDSLAT